MFFPFFPLVIRKNADAMRARCSTPFSFSWADAYSQTIAGLSRFAVLSSFFAHTWAMQQQCRVVPLLASSLPRCEVYQAARIERRPDLSLPFACE